MIKQPSDRIKEEMLLFFLRTSVPRILKERGKKNDS